jgi:hypothetical protein
MSLPAAQQRTLDRIDGDLRARAPDLASKFGMFTRLSRADGPPVTEQLPLSRLRVLLSCLRTFVLVPVAVAMVVAGIVVGGTGAGHAHPARATQLVLSGK